MALSDDLLAHPERLSAVRARLESLVSELDAAAGFLVDEEGTPFATVGHVEFGFPHPLSSLREGDALLKALLGQASLDDASSCLVERVGRRALLALLLQAPPGPKEIRELRRRLRQSARELGALL